MSMKTVRLIGFKVRLSNEGCSAGKSRIPWIYLEEFEKIRFIPRQVNLSLIKGTVNIISSDPPYKDNARFTTVPLKALSGQE